VCSRRLQGLSEQTSWDIATHVPGKSVESQAELYYFWDSINTTVDEASPPKNPQTENPNNPPKKNQTKNPIQANKPTKK